MLRKSISFFYLGLIIASPLQGEEVDNVPESQQQMDEREWATKVRQLMEENQRIEKEVQNHRRENRWEDDRAEDRRRENRWEDEKAAERRREENRLYQRKLDNRRYNR